MGFTMTWVTVDCCPFEFVDVNTEVNADGVLVIVSPSEVVVIIEVLERVVLIGKVSSQQAMHTNYKPHGPRFIRGGCRIRGAGRFGRCTGFV